LDGDTPIMGSAPPMFFRMAGVTQKLDILWGVIEWVFVFVVTGPAIISTLMTRLRGIETLCTFAPRRYGYTVFCVFLIPACSVATSPQIKMPPRFQSSTRSHLAHK
jgi:hypothetical protein